MCNHDHKRSTHKCQACEIESLKLVALNYRKERDAAQLEAAELRERVRQLTVVDPEPVAEDEPSNFTEPCPRCKWTICQCAVKP